MRVLIIGCGYVGKALAKHFLSHGHFVTVTTRHQENVESLRSCSSQVLLFDGKDYTDLQNVLPTQDLVLLTLAADSPDQYQNTYLKTAQSILSIAAHTPCSPMLIYTSSTSVYKENQGGVALEDSSLEETRPLASILVETEKTLQKLSQYGWKACIFRLSEIYGPGRSILDRIKNLEGKKLPGDGNKYTNMIHLDDIVGASNFVFQNGLKGIFNLSDDDHFLRKEWYDQIAETYSLKKVEWDETLATHHGGNKKVSNQKIKEAGYIFKCPHRQIKIP
ncbi:MAG: SDR family oxidoreductase [Chlamydiae bacterium]|nr:SDR family oxidoreductase [Chlamydiota bacterium]